MTSGSFGRRIQAGGIALVLAGGLGGCSPKAQEDLGRVWDALVAQVLKALGSDPGKSTETSAGARGTESSEGDGIYSTDIAKRAQANAELLREIFFVTYMRDPKDRVEFGSLVDTLNQGASLEGVYNGLSHSSEYRKVEISNPGASPEALKTFGIELAKLQSELPAPTRFKRTAASPLPYPVQPGLEGEDRGEPREISFGSAPQAPAGEAGSASADEKGKPDLDALADEYSRIFVGASIYTLKRVICDEAVKVMNLKNEYRENLALWYSKFVARMNEYKVDFGLELRNQSDEDFHYSWALKTDADRVKWEVLNRYHRLLNEANRVKQ